MLANKHPAYLEELENLKDTCLCLDEELDFMTREIAQNEEDLKKLQRTMSGGYSNDVVVKDSINESMKRKLREIRRIHHKPYFGRIDYKELGKDDYETFYIGKTSLARRKDEQRLIVDWRAPIASLYYSGEIGEVMYTAPGGLMIGDLQLKRQYEVEERKLINIFDKGLTPMDEYLQSALWQKKDNRLRDIVTTIQKEQNDIIRGDKGKVLIIQGVAGSGKTTIVLHRIAYLMYTYQEIFTPDKLLILVPNKLFLNYISDVLPDLGVEEINQSTFEDLALKILAKEYDLTDLEEKFLQLLNYKELTKDYREMLKKASAFKGSLRFKGLLDQHIAFLQHHFVPTINLELSNQVIYTYDEIKALFDDEYSYLPLVKRVQRVRGYIEATIKDRVNQLKDRITKQYQKKVDRVKNQIVDDEAQKKELVRVYDRRDNELKSLDSEMQSAISHYFKQWPSIDIEDIYRDMIGKKDVLKQYFKDKKDYPFADFIGEYSKGIFDDGKFEREDLVPLLYLQLKLVGSDMIGRFNHIVVDEAQDYSPFQMYILKLLTSNHSFTIVGDLSQGIYSYKGIKNWQDLMDDVFEENDKLFLKIRKCYRSTMEIMDFANEVIKKHKRGPLTLAEPVLRHGDKPCIIKKETQEAMLHDISVKLLELKREGHKSIAIIGKTEAACKKAYEKLRGSYHGEDLHLITDKDTFYDGGIVVIPIYFAKGLEFDAVVVYNCSKDNYLEDELDIKLLYVALTRPLHKLYLYYTGEISSLIDVTSQVYTREL